MKRKSKKDYYLKNSLKVNFLFSILILAMAIFWNLFCANQLKYKEEFLKNAEKTIATITNIEYRSEIKRDEIEEIYAKTKLISQISKDIHILAKKQENKLESIESNIINVNENAIASSKAIDTKDKASQQTLSSSTNKLISYLLILIIIFILIIYYNST